MHKLAHQLAGELGETLALAKFVSLGLHAYLSPSGAPGHDIMVVTPNGLRSVEVKTRQYIDRPSEISRWPVDMNTKANADFFLFVELNLRTITPTFYLLDNSQAKAVHRDNNGSGNCVPTAVRAAVAENDFSVLTGELPEPPSESRHRGPVASRPKAAHPAAALRERIAQEATYKGSRVVQYACQSIDVFVNGTLQNNTIENLRHIAKPLGVSEYNLSGGVRNTRQLGKAVIEAIKDRA